MLKFTNWTTYYICSKPMDIRKGREGLAQIIRELMERNPLNYNEAFIFYSKDYRKVKILHYDLNGYVLYTKWFDDDKFLKPEFETSKRSHCISRETLILLLLTGIQIKSESNDYLSRN